MLKRKAVTVSEFKAKALEFFAQVAKEGTSLSVTKRGQHIATVVPAASVSEVANIPGQLEGTVEFIDDILEPIGDQIWSATK